jgi:hypothetical protein
MVSGPALLRGRLCGPVQTDAPKNGAWDETANY